MIRSILLAVSLVVSMFSVRASLAQEAAPLRAIGGGQSLMLQAMYWMNMENVRKELEIVPEQKEKLEKLRGEYQTKMTEAYKSLDFRSMKPNEWQTKYSEVTGTLNNEFGKKFEEILLPHQLKRIRQILLQSRLAQSGYGSAAALNDGEVASELGLSDDQREALKKKEAEVRQTIQKKTQEFQKKLSEEARDELYSVLTPAQRKKLEDLQGDKFDWTQGGFGQGGLPGRTIEVQQNPNPK